MQVIDTILVFLSVYLMLLCIEIFSELQNFDIISGDALNPKSSGSDIGKCTQIPRTCDRFNFLCCILRHL